MVEEELAMAVTTKVVGLVGLFMLNLAPLPQMMLAMLVLGLQAPVLAELEVLGEFTLL
jgi:hypothetical protein